MTLEEFITAHQDDEIAVLLLSRDRFPEIDMELAVSTIECRRKLRTKVPQWYGVPGMLYPSVLSAQQCSSSETALYKAEVAAEAIGRGRIADLTGGLGVDTWAFSQVASEVLYNEADKALSESAANNFSRLGINNVSVRNTTLGKDNLKEVLGDFCPDLIYLDPARRASDGRKVFLLEQCLPDVLTLAGSIMETCRFLLLKLSPMADITMAVSRLDAVSDGKVMDVHVVASGGECKELLVMMDALHRGGHVLHVHESGSTLILPPDDGAPLLPTSEDSLESLPGQFLFEPGKALAKAGAFNFPCSVYGMQKLARHTHLFTAKAIPDQLIPFGKCFIIKEILPLNKKNIKVLGKRLQRAEVSSRNIRMTSDDLKGRIGILSGGSVHIYGIRIDFGNGRNDNYLLVGERYFSQNS